MHATTLTILGAPQRRSHSHDSLPIITFVIGSDLSTDTSQTTFNFPHVASICFLTLFTPCLSPVVAIHVAELYWKGFNGISFAFG